MVWYSHLFQNFPQFIVIHTVKRKALPVGNFEYVAMNMGAEISESLLSILLDQQVFLKSSMNMKIIKPVKRP